MRMALVEITTSNSIRVKPRLPLEAKNQLVIFVLHESHRGSSIRPLDSPDNAIHHRKSTHGFAIPTANNFPAGFLRFNVFSHLSDTQI